MSITKQEILDQIKIAMQDCMNENLQRQDIKMTKEYQASQADIDQIGKAMESMAQELHAVKARQDEMLATVPDSTGKLEDLKRHLMNMMMVDGVEGYMENDITVSGKFTEKKKVDGNRLLSVLGGDMDAFMQIVKPTQKAIKDYATERPDLKSSLLSCITLDSRELVDVDIQLIS